MISLKWRRHEAGRIRSAPRFAEHGDASDREGDAMVEVIGIALFVALVWLLVYGMSATEAKGHRLGTDQAERPSPKRMHAA